MYMFTTLVYAICVANGNTYFVLCQVARQAASNQDASLTFEETHWKQEIVGKTVSQISGAKLG